MIIPGAIYRPIPLRDSKGAWWHTNGPMLGYQGAVLHVNESNGNLYNWVAGDHDMSCHVEFYKNGTYEQYIDTYYQSWCQTNGNYRWLSFECEGYNTEAMPDPMLKSIAFVLKTLSEAHGFPLQLTSDPVNGRGFIWHGAGGASWGGHPDCAGPIRNSQRQTILDIINAPIPAPVPVEDEDMAYDKLQKVGDGASAGQVWVEKSAGIYVGCQNGSDVTNAIDGGAKDCTGHPISGLMHLELLRASSNYGQGNAATPGTKSIAKVPVLSAKDLHAAGIIGHGLDGSAHEGMK